MEVVIKIALHANDIAVTLFLQNGKEISDALFIMEGFSGISGLGINQKPCGFVVKSNVWKAKVCFCNDKCASCI